MIAPSPNDPRTTEITDAAWFDPPLPAPPRAVLPFAIAAVLVVALLLWDDWARHAATASAARPAELLGLSLPWCVAWIGAIASLASLAAYALGRASTAGAEGNTGSRTRQAVLR